MKKLITRIRAIISLKEDFKKAKMQFIEFEKELKEIQQIPNEIEAVIKLFRAVLLFENKKIIDDLTIKLNGKKHSETILILFKYLNFNFKEVLKPVYGDNGIANENTFIKNFFNLDPLKYDIDQIKKLVESPHTIEEQIYSTSIRVKSKDFVKINIPFILYIIDDIKYAL